MQPFNQETFTTYLRQRKLTAEHHIPFYVKWVQRFLAADLPLIATSPNDKMQAFENLLAKNPAIQEWQLRQALKAVELYVRVFSTAEESAPAKPVDQGKAIPEAETVYAQMRDLIRVRHYSYRTEQTYLDWARRYIAYALNVELDWKQSDTAKAFLSSLATQRNVAASTQNQAFSALLFLLREVLKQDNPDMKSVRARQGSKLPEVLSADEVRQVLKVTPPGDRLLLQLICPSRWIESIRVRPRSSPGNIFSRPTICQSIPEVLSCAGITSATKCHRGS